MNLLKLIDECHNVNITVTVNDLIETVDYCIDKTRKELEQKIADANTEAYLSPEQLVRFLGVSRSTLWRWSKCKYLVPIEVGGKRRYRMSDVKKILGARASQTSNILSNFPSPNR